MPSISENALRFGVIGPGIPSIHWAQTLNQIGADFWYYSPDERDRERVMRMDIDSVESELPYFTDGYTTVLICAGSFDIDREAAMTEALESGIHVLSEPPLGIESEGARDFHLMARENKAALLTVFPVLYMASFRKLMQWENSEIGDTQYIRMTWAEVARGRDPLWDISPEMWAVVHALCFEDIQSFRVNQGPGWVNTQAQNEKGVTIDMTAMSGMAQPEHSIMISGSEGSILCNPFQEEVVLRNEKGDSKISRNVSIGARRHVLTFFARRLREFSRQEKEPPFGEIGAQVTDFLAQVDGALAQQEV